MNWVEWGMCCERKGWRDGEKEWRGLCTWEKNFVAGRRGFGV